LKRRECAISGRCAGTCRCRSSTSHAVRRGEGEIGFGGAFVVNTGKHTGRSPRDKYIVDEDGTHDTVDWGSVNQPITPVQFAGLHQRVLAYLQGRELFVQDLYAGADPEYRLPVRVVTPSAWHSLFARNMFIRPPVRELAGVPAGVHHPPMRRISSRSPNSTASARRPSSSSISPNGWC